MEWIEIIFSIVSSQNLIKCHDDYRTTTQGKQTFKLYSIYLSSIYSIIFRSNNLQNSKFLYKLL